MTDHVIYVKTKHSGFRSRHIGTYQHCMAKLAEIGGEFSFSDTQWSDDLSVVELLDFYGEPAVWFSVVELPQVTKKGHHAWLFTGEPDIELVAEFLAEFLRPDLLEDGRPLRRLAISYLDRVKADGYVGLGRGNTAAGRPVILIRER